MKKLALRLPIKTSEVFASVEIVRRSDSVNNYNYVLMRREGTKVLMLDKKVSVEDVELFSNVIRKKIPFVLSFSGLGVLYKKTDYAITDSSATVDGLLRHMLPNADPNDFLLEFQRGKSGTVFCALMRRDIFENIVNKWLGKGAFILDVGIGIFSVAEIISLLDDNISRIIVQDYKLIIQDNGLWDYTKLKSKSGNTYSVGGEDLSGDLLPAFANAFRYFILKSKINFSSLISEQRNEFHQYKVSKKLFRIIAVALVLIIIGNFGTSYLLSTKLEQADIRLATSKQVLHNYSELSEKYNRKKEVLDAQGISNENYISVLIDKIARVIPASVYLNKIQYNPRLKKTLGDKLFKVNTIIVSGRASNVRELYKWINDLDKIERITGVKLSSYNYNREEEQADFEIVITLES